MRIHELAPIRKAGNSGIGRPRPNAPKVRNHFNKKGYMAKFVASHSRINLHKLQSFSGR